MVTRGPSPSPSPSQCHHRHRHQHRCGAAGPSQADTESPRERGRQPRRRGAAGRDASGKLGRPRAWRLSKPDRELIFSMLLVDRDRCLARREGEAGQSGTERGGRGREGEEPPPPRFPGGRRGKRGRAFSPSGVGPAQKVRRLAQRGGSHPGVCIEARADGRARPLPRAGGPLSRRGESVARRAKKGKQGGESPLRMMVTHLHAFRVDRVASILSTAGHCPYSSTWPRCAGGARWVRPGGGEPGQQRA